MATRRYYSANAVDNTVSSAINSTSTTVTLSTSPVGYPGTYPFVVALDYNSASEELVLVTNASGNTLNITRGYNGTSQTGHNAGAVVRHVVIAQDLTDFQDHAAASSGVHGVTGAVIGSTDTQTLTNKTISGSSNTITNVSLTTGVTGTLPAANGGTGITSLGTGIATFLGTPSSANLAAAISDETGSGPIVFATGPTINSPVITGTIAASGSTGASGQYLSSTATGIAWVTPATTNLVLNPQTGTTYTLVSSDLNKLITLSNSGAITLTIPSAVFTVGQQINIQQIGAGQVTVQGDGTSTFTGTGTKLRTQYSAATIVCTGTNTFTLIGDLA
jgi:hypothetical protein